MSKMSCTYSIDVRVASWISERYSDTRHASEFVNKVLSDFIDSQQLSPEKIDELLREEKVSYQEKVKKLLAKKRDLLGLE